MATKNLIPRSDGEGGIGKPGVAWGSGVFKTGSFQELTVQVTELKIEIKYLRSENKKLREQNIV